MATTKITSPDLFNLESLNTALKLPSGTTAERPTSPSTGEWRYNTTTNLVEFYDGGAWRDLQSEDIPPVNSENFKTILYDGSMKPEFRFWNFWFTTYWRFRYLWFFWFF